jgi:hypothetical protein
MANRREYPVKFTPRGLADAWDSSESFQGACRSLQNLVFDQSNPDLMTCRPGVGSPITTFSGFNNPTGVSVYTVIGTIVYGMVSTARYTGNDEPFAYNILTGSFVTISGVTSGNVPTTQSTSGDWTPPTIAVIGTKIIITHPGFSGAGSNFFGVIDVTNPSAPAWSAANTASNALPSVPTAVVNFNNRAYYACGNYAYYSDVLVPTTMTNAGQALTVGDTTPITGFSGLPVQTTSGGVVGALMVFKSFQIWQITGDAAISGSLAQNFLSLNIGCISPRTIVQTPIGLIFIGIDGPYYVSALGQVLPLTKDLNKLTQDVQKPFQNIQNPSRASASFTGAVYRICVDTIIGGQFTTNDYWFDVTVRRWNGPHTFPYDCASQYSNYFVVSSRKIGAMLFASQYIPELNSIYNDNGNPLSVSLQTCMLPRTQNINVKQVIESTVELASLTNTLSYTVSALGENYNTLNSTTIATVNQVPVWGGGGVWGTSGQTWTNSGGNPITYTIPWTNPLVFKKISITITAVSTYSLEIGSLLFKYIDTGYTNI